MDKYQSNTDGKQITKRPRWLTLCMMATAASVIVLAGCGDDEETVAPAEEPSPLEQDATEEPESGIAEEPSMQQDSSLDEESTSEGSMTQDEGVESEQPMSNQGTPDDEDMPEDTMDESVEGNTNPGDDDEAGFGEGTEPMPGAEDDENSTSNQ